MGKVIWKLNLYIQKIFFFFIIILFIDIKQNDALIKNQLKIIKILLKKLYSNFKIITFYSKMICRFIAKNKGIEETEYFTR